jgi:TonB family protein
MKILFSICFVACLHPWQLVSAASPDGIPAEADVGIGIEQTGVLVYPPLMTVNAIYSGGVRAVISVDEHGNLTDCLLTSYTQQAFADAAFAALQRWKYQPARVNGQRVASRADVLFEFRDRGVFVQSFPGAIVRHAFLKFLEEHQVYKACLLRDLDRIPTPVHVVTPVVKAESTSRSVIVGFYIDEQGRVRMPAVEREEADDVLAAAAVAAVEQWRFEPPLRKGQPVLVYAKQEFTFRAQE